jgi:hypothetical protein
MASLAKDSEWGRKMVSVQKYTYLPLLCFARFSWLHAGIQFAWQLDSELPGFIESTDQSVCETIAMESTLEKIDPTLFLS